MNPARQALFARLDANVPLEAIVGNRIYHGRAPQDAAFPLVILAKQSGTPQHTFTDRIDSELWLVKAVAKGSSAGAAEDAAAAIDVALHDAPLAIAGHATLYVRRESDINYPEHDGADSYHHVGAIYRLITEPA